jgi:hypothetical protein
MCMAINTIWAAVRLSEPHIQSLCNNIINNLWQCILAGKLTRPDLKNTDESKNNNFQYFVCTWILWTYVQHKYLAKEGHCIGITSFSSLHKIVLGNLINNLITTHGKSYSAISKKQKIWSSYAEMSLARDEKYPSYNWNHDVQVHIKLQTC